MTTLFKKLLVCSHTYGLHHNRAKLRRLAEHFEIVVVCTKFENWPIYGRPGEELDEQDPGEQFPVIKLSRYPKTTNSTRFILKGLTQTITDFAPDIILCENEPWSLMRWQAWLIKKIYLPNSIFAEFTWENIPRGGPRGWVLRQLYRLAAMTGQKFICGNQSAAKLLRDAGLSPDQLLVSGQMGVDPWEHPAATEEEKTAWKTSHELPADARIIGFCGRLVEEKGILDLLSAVISLREKHPDIHLFLLGSGPMYSSLSKIEQRESWFKILPPLVHHEVPHTLKQFDLLVLPSKKGYRNGRLIWEEQFGHVLIESMAAGVLTLGSRSGGIPEVLNDESVLFEPNDVHSLEKTMDRFLSDPLSSKSKADEQRRNCLARWDNKAVARNYRDFLLS